MKAKQKKSPIEEFIALPDDEKERIWESFNEEFVFEKARPLNAAERKLWRRAKRKMGRPVKGQGHKVISVSLEKGLLERADAYAKKQRTTRAALIARALEAVIPAPKRSRAAR